MNHNMKFVFSLSVYDAIDSLMFLLELAKLSSVNRQKKGLKHRVSSLDMFSFLIKSHFKFGIKFQIPFLPNSSNITENKFTWTTLLKIRQTAINSWDDFLTLIFSNLPLTRITTPIIPENYLISKHIYTTSASSRIQSPEDSCAEMPSI